MRSILDLGCGRGAKISHLQRRGDVTGIDISPEFVDICSKQFPKSKFIVMDGLSLKFPPSHFDEIYCMDVIEHVTDPIRLMQQIRRVIKDDGLLYLDVPHYLSEKLLTTFNPAYPHQVHHQTVFKPEQIIKILNDNSFKITKCRYIKFIDNYYLLRHFLNGHTIENQQGDIIPQTEADKLLLLIMQHVYQKNGHTPLTHSPLFPEYDKLSIKIYHLPLLELFRITKVIDELVSPTFPKTVSLVCTPDPNPQNSRASISPQAISTLVSRLSNSSQITKLQAKITSNNTTQKRLRQRIDKLDNQIKQINYERDILSNQLTHAIDALTKINSSKFYKLYPIYEKLKSIVKSITNHK